MADEKRKSVSVGGGWKKTSQGGTNYISCKLNNGKFLTIFVNGRKENDKQPDYRLLMDEVDAKEMGLEYHKEENGQ